MGALLQRVTLSLVAAASSASAEDRDHVAVRAPGALLRSVTDGARRGPRSTPPRASAAPRDRASAPAPELAGHTRRGDDELRRVLGARVQLAPRGANEPEPVAELDEDWIDLSPPPRRPFRPKYMLDVMSFPTGGSGIKLKVRY